MDISAVDPATGQPVAVGGVAPEQMEIQVTLPAREQEKLPVFKDIMIMMAVRWSNTSYLDVDLNENILF